MKAKLNEYSQHTYGQIAAAQGAAAAMPLAMIASEVITLNSMFRELLALKAWSATAATKDEVGHHERRINFIDIQISGTNEKLNALTTKVE